MEEEDNGLNVPQFNINMFLSLFKFPHSLSKKNSKDLV